MLMYMSKEKNAAYSFVAAAKWKREKLQRKSFSNGTVHSHKHATELESQKLLAKIEGSSGLKSFSISVIGLVFFV